jgi:Xaa-Pro aminopeptidase
MEMNRQCRVEKLRGIMDESEYRMMLITSPANIFYLSGFTGSSGALIISDDKQILLSDFRYKTQSQQESPDWEFINVSIGLLPGINEEIKRHIPCKIAFESEHISYSAYKVLSSDGLLNYLIPTKNIIEDIRIIKDRFEIDIIRKAAEITDIACERVFEIIRAGITEREIALEAEYTMRKAGASGLAFDVIIGAGENGAKPHSIPGDYRLKNGDMVVIDMGAKYQGYCADMTRTICIGEADEISQQIYNICYLSQTTSLDFLQAGIKGCDVDSVARNIITDSGYGDLFGHGLGHSVGIEIHENPRLSKTSNDIIPAGTVITVEPGIYIPGKAGVRIEDMVLVTDTGCEIITGVSKPKVLQCM